MTYWWQLYAMTRIKILVIFVCLLHSIFLKMTAFRNSFIQRGLGNLFLDSELFQCIVLLCLPKLCSLPYKMDSWTNGWWLPWTDMQIYLDYTCFCIVLTDVLGETNPRHIEQDVLMVNQYLHHDQVVPAMSEHPHLIQFVHVVNWHLPLKQLLPHRQTSKTCLKTMQPWQLKTDLKWHRFNNF